MEYAKVEYAKMGYETREQHEVGRVVQCASVHVNQNTFMSA